MRQFHNHVVPGDKMEDLAQNFSNEKPTAPISPARPATLDRRLLGSQANQRPEFGGTKLRGGDMPSFVKERFGDPSEQKKNIAKWCALLPRPFAFAEDARAATPRPSKGPQVIVGDFGCNHCHNFQERPSGRPPS